MNNCIPSGSVSFDILLQLSRWRIPITEVLLSHEFTQVPASWLRPQGTYINSTGFTFPLPEGRSKDKRDINRMLDEIHHPPSSAGVLFRN